MAGSLVLSRLVKLKIQKKQRGTVVLTQRSSSARVQWYCKSEIDQ